MSLKWIVKAWRLNNCVKKPFFCQNLYLFFKYLPNEWAYKTFEPHKRCTRTSIMHWKKRIEKMLKNERVMGVAVKIFVKNHGHFFLFSLLGGRFWCFKSWKHILQDLLLYLGKTLLLCAPPPSMDNDSLN